MNVVFRQCCTTVMERQSEGSRLSHRCRSSSAPSPACESYWASSGWGPGGRWPCPEEQIKVTGGQTDRLLKGERHVLKKDTFVIGTLYCPITLSGFPPSATWIHLYLKAHLISIKVLKVRL